MKPSAFILITAVSAFLVVAPGAQAQGTAFTYQGRLNHGGSPANGLYETSFALYDAVTNGNAVGVLVAVAPVPVSNGLFTVTLDFGSAAFMGADRWLEIAVTVFGSDQPVTTLVPRQPMTPTPYALHAANAAGLMNFTGAPLDIKVNGERMLRLEFTGSGPNVIGGASVNSVGPDVIGATISGGGTSSPGFEATNRVEASYGTIAGGGAHTIRPGSRNSAISGGWQNTIRADSGWSTIGGGESNTIEPNARYSTIGGGALNKAAAYASVIDGGSLNTVQTNAEHSAIGGGLRNDIYLDAKFSTIAGGANNTHLWRATYGTIGGGRENTIGLGFDASTASTIAGGWLNRTRGDNETIGGGYKNQTSHNNSTVAGGTENFARGWGATVGGGAANLSMDFCATVSGGQYNTSRVVSATVGGGKNNTSGEIGATVSGGIDNTASGLTATVPGGWLNTASGHYSFAAGWRAKALHRGAFVWADSSLGPIGIGLDFASTSSNQFLVRATGGAHFVSAIDTTGSNIAGVTLAPGSGTWSSLSDRNAKENFTAANAREILDKVAALPLASWNYKAQGAGVRHLGPMAQDFHASFGLGESERTITTVDADGVALAAIQGLNEKVEVSSERAEGRIEKLEKENAELKTRLAMLEVLVMKFAAKGN